MSSGHNSYANYGVETTYSTATTTALSFGHGISISACDKTNNLKRIYGLGSRNAAAFAAGKFEGALTIDFDITEDPWWFECLLGSWTTASTESPYTHTFSEANLPPSMTIENGIDMTTDAVMDYKGVVIAEAKIVAEVGDAPAHCTLTCLYGDEANTSASISTQATESGTVYSFGEATLEVPNGTTISNTERVELTIVNNAILGYGLGARTSSYRSMGAREYSVITVNYFDDHATYMASLYGTTTQVTTTPSSIATLELNLTRGTGATLQSIAILLTTASINSISLPQVCGEVNMETVEIFASSGAITVVNNSSSSS